jgi:membrane protease YdiL (CAAX protease family)
VSEGWTIEKPRARRCGEAFLFVAGWVALGLLLRLDWKAYLVVGIPWTLAFQLLVRRRPMRALWVREAPPMRFDRLTMLLTAAFAVVPASFLLQLTLDGQWSSMPFALAALGGALAAAYALRQFRATTVRALLLCLATAGLLGTLVFLGVALALAQQHMRTPHRPSLRAFFDHLLILFPVSFIVEEVSFRGAIDAHVHNPGETRGWLSAIYVCALWGLWHVPVMHAQHEIAAAATQAGLQILYHVAVGVPLCIFWRRSGNLAVPAFSHAWVDAIRNALGLFRG